MKYPGSERGSSENQLAYAWHGVWLLVLVDPVVLVLKLN